MVAEILDQALLIFGLTFALQFADRSTFGVFSLAARHDPLDVWVGSALGFLAATAVSIVIGVALLRYLGPDLVWVRVASGVVLMLFGVRELLRSPAAEAAESVHEAEAEVARHRVWVAAFALILLLEMGGNTQVLAILFVAATGNPFLVLVVAWLALVLVTAIEIRGAVYLRAHVRPESLERGLGLALLIVGAAAILLALEPGLLPIGL
jgi:putative Ca2+/H+ antiporter (TMEM165/GDT1 family)